MLLKKSFSLRTSILIGLVLHGIHSAVRGEQASGDPKDETLTSTFVVNGDQGFNPDPDHFDHHETAVTIQVYDESITNSQEGIDDCRQTPTSDYEEISSWDTKWRHVCGGTLISHNLVVTSYKCIKDYESALTSNSLRVGVGWWEFEPEGYDYYEDTGTGGVSGETKHGHDYQTFSVIAIMKHPNYQENGDGTTLNNIAVVKLNDSVIENDDVKIADMSEAGEDETKKVCKFHGWGATGCYTKTRDKSMATRVWGNIVQGAELNVTTRTLCEKMWMLKEMSVSQTELCAYNWKTHSTICDGDYGGGLMCNTTGPPYTTFRLTAVASRNDADCHGCLPAVFEKVSDYRTWLDTKISENA